MKRTAPTIGSGADLVAGSPQERPSAADVRLQLECLIASPSFDLPLRGRKFLRYVVEETLAGRAERIKAYSIAIAVFGREPTFDAQADPVVRIEAGRLRRALEHYYLAAGVDDPLVIDIPKGGYVPTFTARPVAPDRPAEPAPAAPEIAADVPRPHSRSWWIGAAAGAGAIVLVILVASLALRDQLRRESLPANPAAASLPRDRPSLAVMPFVNLGDGAEGKLYADGLTEEILSQLTRFKDLSVLGRETTRSLRQDAGAMQTLRELQVRYVLEGSVRATEQRLRVVGRLLEADTGLVLWSHSYDQDTGLRNLFVVQDNVARQVATALGQPYGVIHRADERRVGGKTPEDLEAYACSLRFYEYRTALSAAAHAAIRTCLERAVERQPGYATAWAMLAILYLDEDRFGFNPRPGSPDAGQRSVGAARLATRLEADNARALQALMVALFFTRQPSEALEVGEQAIALNPNDTELLGEFGSRLGQAGYWERGTALLNQALAQNPAQSGYYKGMLALHAYMQRDYQQAAQMFRHVSLDKFPLYHLVGAIIYAQAGRMTEAAEFRTRFLEARPTFFDHWDEEMAKRNYPPADAAHLARGARKAGFPLSGVTTAEAGVAPSVPTR